jgi:hypothetical protein
MKKSNKKGTWIDQEIMDDFNLDCVDRFILTEIYSLCKLPNGCIAGDEHFSEIIRKSISNTNKRINRLKNLGYINTFIHTKNKKIIGRTITINKKEKNDIVFQSVEVSISKEEDLVFQNVEVSISKEEDLVFQNVEVSISPVNINNTVTNSDIIIQEINQYTGAVIDSSLSMNQFLNNRYEELVFELVNKCSLGEEIFFYIDPKNQDLFRDAVDDQEYKIVYPLITSVLDISRKLFGN